jgi:TctA family transporter
MVGTDLNSGQYRYTFGANELLNGFPFVPVVVGLFGIADILLALERSVRDDVMPVVGKISSLWPTKDEIRQALPASLRGTFFGLILGLLPGGGALLSSFVSYSAEKRFSLHPEEFGKGNPAGVASPEAANNSGAQSSFLPLLTLGLPSNAVMAVMAGAMYIHGIVPGPRIMTSQPGLFWGLIASMWIGNLMLLIINLPLVGMWVQMLKVRYSVLYPIIIAVSLIGIFGVDFSVFDVYLTAGVGLFGYLMAKWKCEPAPLILAFVLGPMIEQYFRRALLVGRGSFSIFVERPISLAMLAVIVVLLTSIAVPGIRTARQKIFTD